ncbi:MAG: recombinase family protein [Chthonomonadales bacterium]
MTSDGRCIIYCRVSTEAQTEGTSLETQEAACRAKAAQLGLQVAAVYRDEGVSGSLLAAREGLQQALAAIEAGQASVLITAKLDRASRDLAALLQIRRRLKKANATLVFADGPSVGDGPVENFLLSSLGAVAALERDLIRDRCMSGKVARVKEGTQVARTLAPYGYRVPTKADVLAGKYPPEAVGKYIIQEDEAAVVRDIFQRYAAGASLRAIALDLNRRGVPTPRGGLVWHITTIRAILLNPVHKGEAAFGRSEFKTDEDRLAKGLRIHYLRPRKPGEWLTIPCPAIVDAATWEACQRRLATNNGRIGGNPKRVFLLNGILRCPQCGRRLYGTTIPGKGRKPPIRGYVCQNVSHPTSTRFDAEQIEAAALRLVEDALASQESIEAAIQAYADQQAELQEDAARIAELKQKLAAVAQKEAKAVAIRLEHDVSAEAMAEVMASLRNERRKLEAELAELTKPKQKAAQPRLDPGEAQAVILRMLKTAAATLKSDAVSVAEKRRILTTILERLDVKDGELTATFTVPFDKTVHKVGTS